MNSVIKTLRIAVQCKVEYDVCKGIQKKIVKERDSKAPERLKCVMNRETSVIDK
jgi:hypothetical protein